MEYGRRKVVLDRALDDHPGQPLILALGTSRMALGLHSGAMGPVVDGDGCRSVVFNFGVPAYGPVHSLVCLDRLLRGGIRPRAVVLEYWPPSWSRDVADKEFDEFDPAMLGWRDIRLLRRYTDRPWRLHAEWAAARLGASWANRAQLQRKLGSGWLAPEVATVNHSLYRPLDPWGWLHVHGCFDERNRREAEQATRRRFAPLLADFRASPAADRAARGLFARCRRAGTRVALVWMPESPQFRDWYSPTARQRAETYFEELGRQPGVVLVNTRDWMPAEAFFDTYHLVSDGAAVYSRRLAREALPALVCETVTVPDRRTPGVGGNAGRVARTD